MGHLWFQHSLFRHSVFPLALYVVLLFTAAAIVMSLMELLGFLGK